MRLIELKNKLLYEKWKNDEEIKSRKSGIMDILDNTIKEVEEKAQTDPNIQVIRPQVNVVDSEIERYYR